MLSGDSFNIAINSNSRLADEFLCDIQRFFVRFCKNHPFPVILRDFVISHKIIPHRDTSSRVWFPSAIESDVSMAIHRKSGEEKST